MHCYAFLKIWRRVVSFVTRHFAPVKEADSHSVPDWARCEADVDSLENRKPSKPARNEVPLLGSRNM